MYNRAFDAHPEDEVVLHRDLLAVVLSGDPDRAEAAIRAHVRDSASRVLAKLMDSDRS
jgi:DNA-binding FadR family transcriptional regulator